MAKKILFIFTFLLITSKVWCQIVVTGQVIVKEEESPLPGGLITEKGTQNGTLSKLDGTFSINVSDASATLILSFIGFATQEYHLKGANEILVKMKM